MRFAAARGIFYDSNLRREQIIVPEVLSLQDNYEQIAALLYRMREVALSDRRPIMVHLNHVKQVETAAALVLVAEMDRIRRFTNFAFVHGTYPQDWEVMKSLSDMGFFAVIRAHQLPPQRGHRELRPVFFPFISDTEVQPVVADAFVSLIEKHLIPMNALTRSRLVVAIKEAMQNTIDHAHPSQNPTARSRRSRWWLSARFDVAKSEVSIVFFDAGVGIPSTLGAEKYERIMAALRNLSRLKFDAEPSDGQLIAAATEKHRSGTGDERRGLGFFNMKQLIEACQEGELRVLSKRGRYHYIDSDTEGFANSERSLDGTVIEWRFRNDGALEME